MFKKWRYRKVIRRQMDSPHLLKIQKKIFSVVTSMGAILCIFSITALAWFSDSVSSRDNRIRAGSYQMAIYIDYGDADGYVLLRAQDSSLSGSPYITNAIDAGSASKTIKIKVQNSGQLDRGALDFQYTLHWQLPDEMQADYPENMPPFSQSVVLEPGNADEYTLVLTGGNGQIKLWVEDNFKNYKAKTRMDVLLFAGDSTSFDDRGAAEIGLVSPGTYAFLPAAANPLTTFENAAGDGLGSAALGTAAKKYLEMTGRQICIVPAGLKDPATSGEYTATVQTMWDAFSNWLKTRADIDELGNVMLLWNPPAEYVDHGGTHISGAQITQEVFDILKNTSIPIQTFYFCRIAPGGLSDGGAATVCNKGLLDLENTLSSPAQVIVSNNAAEYYWQDHITADGQYDTFASVRLGTEIGTNIARHVSGTNVLLKEPFENTVGGDSSLVFPGIVLRQDKMVYAQDFTRAICSRYYDSYAEISPLTLDIQNAFSFAFSIQCMPREFSENAQTAVILGSAGTDNLSSVLISEGKITVTPSAATVADESGADILVPALEFISDQIDPFDQHKTYRLSHEAGSEELVLEIDDAAVGSPQIVSPSFTASFDLVGRNESAENTVSYLGGYFTKY